GRSCASSPATRTGRTNHPTPRCPTPSRAGRSRSSSSARWRAAEPGGGFRMLRKLLIGIVVVVGLLALVVATRPAEVRVARPRTLQAPPEAVFAYVNDFHNWPRWSPWEKVDPALHREHTGAPAGTGAVYAWSGNHDVGEGRMTITDSRPPRTIVIR